MAPIGLNQTAIQENVRALMSAAGVGEEVAAKRLDSSILVTFEHNDGIGSALVEELLPILTRTLRASTLVSNAVQDHDFEIVVGAKAPRTGLPHLYVSVCALHCEISSLPSPHEDVSVARPLLVAIACYVAAAAIYRTVAKEIPNPPPDPLIVKFESFGLPPDAFVSPLDIGETFLAGAGAIGNGFLWAARAIDIRGVLRVVDDDHVSPGNLQRQIWFEEQDIGSSKAETLCRKAQVHFPKLTLSPSPYRLQGYPAKTSGAWLRRLIVAVDSRQARRNLQNELPGEVFDASTTDVREIVVHHNKQPNQSACLGCVYPRDTQEVRHEEAIAEHLGVTVADIRHGRITASVAARICQKHTQLLPANITGLACDTLYKALCSSGQLQTPSGKQVIAPFAFVSVLAGALLLFELLRTLSTGLPPTTNEWRISPWQAPFGPGRYQRGRSPTCDCCGRPLLRRASEAVWGHLQQSAI